MSNAHMQPTITPRTNGLAFSKAPSHAIKLLLTQAIGELTTAITIPVKKTPNTGYKKIAFKPSNDFGNFSNSFMRPNTM